jgi:hypothetical protein
MPLAATAAAALPSHPLLEIMRTSIRPSYRSAPLLNRQPADPTPSEG